MDRKVMAAAAALVLFGAGGLYGYQRLYADTADAIPDIDAILGKDFDAAPPPAVAVTQTEVKAQPKDTSALGGYDVLIADRGNNRVIEVTPDKRIVWEYDFRGLPGPGFGADDSFFADGGRSVSVNLENYHLLERIDYQSKQVTWRYGTGGAHGSGPGYLYSPDDAYKLENGDVMVADIVNCRVIEISPDKRIVRQYGKTRDCRNKPGLLAAPNGDTPLPDGHVLISTILNHSVLELDSAWKPVFSMVLPLKYPSDPQLTSAGNILVAEYKNPGKIIEITRQGQVVWEYDSDPATGVGLNKPSIAIELPNGNILATDDLNHRVIVIDKQTKHIVWQYGVTGKPGASAGQLNIPDGIDIIMRTALAPVATSSAVVHAVGAVTRHAAPFVGQQLSIEGYLLKKEANDIIISDEPTGAIGVHDLPVVGPGIEQVLPGTRYIFDGIFLDHGFAASNGSAYHLELSNPPRSP